MRNPFKNRKTSAQRLFFQIRAFLLILGFLCSSLSWAQQKLILVGGGERPALALKRLADWSHQEQGRILLITWASEVPEEYADSLTQDLRPQFHGQLDYSLRPPTTPEEIRIAIEQVAKADGIFFSGGDQSRLMSAFQISGGDALRKVFEEAYQQGKPFGGTSAGTAIMSQNMITGDIDNGRVPIDRGLGLLPKDVIVDQHFTQRNREQRLMLAKLQTGTRLAVGIDEDTAFVLEDQSHLEVLGKHEVHLFEGDHPSQETHIFQEGDTGMLPGFRPRISNR